MTDTSITSSELFVLAEFFYVNADAWIRDMEEGKNKEFLVKLQKKMAQHFENETGKILVENKDIPNPFYVWLEEQHKEAAESLSTRAVSRWATLDEVLTKLKEITG